MTKKTSVEFESFTKILKAVLSPEAKKAVDEDNKKRKSKKTSASKLPREKGPKGKQR